MFTTEKENAMFVVSLDIDPMGQATERIPDLEKSAQLHNTLLQGLFPDIRVARLNVPGGVLDESQQALVEQTMKRVNVDGVQFRLIGASGSAKDGKFYAVEAKYERAIAERFLNWPQAAITYFGVLVSPCKVRIEASDVRVIVVKDHDFGTNDWSVLRYHRTPLANAAILLRCGSKKELEEGVDCIEIVRGCWLHNMQFSTGLHPPRS